MRAAGIDNLKDIPNTSDPEHPHVKAILIIYSFECFLFKKLNKSSRDKDSSVIKTLGPYAVAISRVIEKVQQKRLDKIIGSFICFRGITLPPSLIENWKNRKFIDQDGYISASRDERVAIGFAN